ncbi:AmmeMemoRadiSam system radical SAM enzyme [candidate division WOR-3 bacterium]|nr:AmmeMemoRadiSam system radical SAM enzyme [candidate division WOR-3 bacterium]
MLVEARYWTPEQMGARCLLCPNRCLVTPGKSGRCLGRTNENGVLYATNYGEVVSVGLDPIEKKPLYHFLPGTDTLSVASYGCNLRCPFCQNSEISQHQVPARVMTPNELVALAQEHGAPAVSYTYSEPMVWFEYVMDSARLLKDAGFRTVLVTNGTISPEPLAELLPLIDAMNIDLKSIRPGFYREYVKGDLDTVLNTIRAARKACHVELTNLLVPGHNDSDEEVHELVDFVAGLRPETVLHFSRYFPRHRETASVTPAETLARAAAIGRRRLRYVYLGNVATSPVDRDTLCPSCGNRLVDRSEYRGHMTGVTDGRCGRCGRPADLVPA